VSAKGLRALQAKAWALVLTTVVASAMTRMIATAGSLSRVAIGTSAVVEGVACVSVVAETLVHRDCGELPTVLWHLVDQCVRASRLRGCMMAGNELASSREQVLSLLRRRTLE